MYSVTSFKRVLKQCRAKSQTIDCNHSECNGKRHKKGHDKHAWQHDLLVGTAKMCSEFESVIHFLVNILFFVINICIFPLISVLK